MADMNLDSPKQVQKEMAQQLAGFRTLSRFRSFGYKAAVVAGVIVGIGYASREPTQKALTDAFFAMIFGLAGVRILTSPIALVLWYRNWRCPNCKKRLGMSVVSECPACHAVLFDRT